MANGTRLNWDQKLVVEQHDRTIRSVISISTMRVDSRGAPKRLYGEYFASLKGTPGSDASETPMKRRGRLVCRIRGLRLSNALVLMFCNCPEEEICIAHRRRFDLPSSNLFPKFGTRSCPVGRHVSDISYMTMIKRYSGMESIQNSDRSIKEDFPALDLSPTCAQDRLR